MTTVRDIIIAHLRSIGADGLCGACQCSIDKIMHCSDDYSRGFRECVPAKKVRTAAGEEIFVPMEQEDAT
jgi:hypothetical protein